MLALAVIGPGIMAGNSGNDPSGIYGYSATGALFGYRMLWLLALAYLNLYIMQETCARMAAATGKGLSDLIREEYGVKIALLAMATLFVANFFTTVSEFAGLSAAIDLLAQRDIHRLVMPLAAVAIWLIVMRGTYRGVEKTLVATSIIYLAYVVTAWKSQPDWGAAALGLVPSLAANSEYLRIAISLVGTTITPWGLFFIQSSIRDKGTSARHFRLIRLDILSGSLFAGLIAACILIACAATLHPHGIRLDANADAADVAKALSPLVGSWASILFGIGLLNAAMYGAIVVPISTAYAVTEALGWESGLGRRMREAPLFAGVYALMVGAAALLVTVASPASLGFLIQLPNVVNGVLLPMIILFILKLVNNREIMGVYANNRWQNFAGYAATVLIVVLSLALVGISLA